MAFFNDMFPIFKMQPHGTVTTEYGGMTVCIFAFTELHLREALGYWVDTMYVSAASGLTNDGMVLPKVTEWLHRRWMDFGMSIYNAISHVGRPLVTCGKGRWHS